MSDRQTRNGTTASSIRQETAPSVETLFEALANPYRRFVLSVVREEDYMPVDDLARTVAAWKAERTIADVSAADRDRVVIALYHVHLPKLDSAGLLDYDRERQVVTLGEAADIAEPYLELAERS